jgi:hypothetical protein
MWELDGGVNLIDEEEVEDHHTSMDPTTEIHHHHEATGARVRTCAAELNGESRGAA